MSNTHQPAIEATARDESERSEVDPPIGPLRYRKNLILFVATVFSVFLSGAYQVDGFAGTEGVVGWLYGLSKGWLFAVPLMTILLFHEFGHYFAARYHRVAASLPFFLPLPFLSPFGTMGAVIAMPNRIRSRNALLDIGAAGPLAGLVIALPVLAYGLATSPVRAIEGPGVQEGQSLLYIAMKAITLGTIPEGYDVFLNPIAFAGWTGLFVTALNLLPIAQLDGGHIAYALFGKRQNRYANILHWSLLGMFALNLAIFMPPAIRSGDWSNIGQAFSNSLAWLIWFGLLFGVRRLGGKDHPPTEEGPLSPGRQAIAILSLVIFLLLFMPTPLSTYG